MFWPIMIRRSSVVNSSRGLRRSATQRDMRNVASGDSVQTSPPSNSSRVLFGLLRIASSFRSPSFDFGSRLLGYRFSPIPRPSPRVSNRNDLNSLVQHAVDDEEGKPAQY